MDRERYTRREVMGLVAAGAVAGHLPQAAWSADNARMVTRRIPRTEETVPVIGMGSSNTFDVGGDAAEREPLREVLRLFTQAGGAVIDTSPMYGRSEEVLGDLFAELKMRPKIWLATKVWTQGRVAGAEQIADSMRKLRTERLELLQIHNLLDWREHVPTLRGMKDDGKLRFTGITHYRADAHADVERVLRAERFDWVQINYSLAEREAERSLFPYCQEQGIAVLANRPFADGGLFDRSPRQEPAALGRGDRLCVLGAVLPALRRLAPGRHLRDPGDGEAASHAGQCCGRRHAAARRQAAHADGRVLRHSVSAVGRCCAIQPAVSRPSRRDPW